MRIAARNIVFFAVLLLSATAVFAQPSGQVGFGYGATNVPVWDLTGPYVLDQPMTGAGDAQLPLSYSIYINHDPNGHLHGSGTTLVTSGGTTVAATYSVSGSVSGGVNGARASLSVKLKGKDSIAEIGRAHV